MINQYLQRQVTVAEKTKLTAENNRRRCSHDSKEWAIDGMFFIEYHLVRFVEYLQVFYEFKRTVNPAHTHSTKRGNPLSNMAYTRVASSSSSYDLQKIQVKLNRLSRSVIGPFGIQLGLSTNPGCRYNRDVTSWLRVAFPLYH